MSDDELAYWAAHFRRRPPSWRLAQLHHVQLIQILARLSGNDPPRMEDLTSWTDYGAP